MALQRIRAVGNQIPSDHALRLRGRRHSDPFDRLLVAQAREESLPGVSQDIAFDLYRVKRIW